MPDLDLAELARRANLDGNSDGKVMTADDEPPKVEAAHDRRMDRLASAIGTGKMKLLELLGVAQDVAGLSCFDDAETRVGCFGPITAEEDPAVMTIAEFVETDIVLTLDSGCVDHLVDMGDIPGYACVLEASPGSKRGQRFVVGNGAKVRNEGQVLLQMSTTSTGRDSNLCSVFQVAEITRPLMSVSRICDHGLECLFTKKNAKILSPDGAVLAVFEREGGLYTATMKLKAPKHPENGRVAADPSGFHRPER